MWPGGSHGPKIVSQNCSGLCFVCDRRRKKKKVQVGASGDDFFWEKRRILKLVKRRITVWVAASADRLITCRRFEVNRCPPEMQKCHSSRRSYFKTRPPPSPPLLVFEFANRWRREGAGEDEQSAVISLGRFFRARSFNKAG